MDRKIHIQSSCEVVPEVQYWQDDVDVYDSPLRSSSGLVAPLSERKYVVFEPDLGGWNNIRMSLEVCILFALATGRILVLPPDSVLYLMVLNSKWKNNKKGIQNYIDLNRTGLDIIDMPTFLTENAVSNDYLQKPYPFDKDVSVGGKKLWSYLEAACYSRVWKPGKTFMVFNITTSSSGGVSFGNKFNIDKRRYHIISFGGSNRQLIPYDSEIHSHRTIYFAGTGKNRILTIFYAYLFFAEPVLDKLMKRFVRDRVRYHDIVYCVASKIVSKLKALSDSSSSSKYPNYVTFHIRRGDFQHKWVKIPAEEIIANVQKENLVQNMHQRIAYIATDEKNASFFQPFHKVFKAVYFLKDFKKDWQTLENMNWLGLVDKVVASTGDVFIGTPLSTFTSYITRMRGYRNESFPGLYDRSYYYMNKFMYQLQQKPHMSLPLWPREFVEAFQDINL